MSKARGSYRVDPLGHKKKSPVLLNGLTEAETNATASVMGLVEQKVLEHAPCLGMNCGITRTDQMHSAECQAEHAATIAGGKFVKSAQRKPLTDEQAHQTLLDMGKHIETFGDESITEQQLSAECIRFIFERVAAHGIKGDA